MLLFLFFSATSLLFYRSRSIPAYEIFAELANETNSFKDVLDVVDSSLVSAKCQDCLVQVKRLPLCLLHEVYQLFCMSANCWVLGSFSLASNFLIVSINLVSLVQLTLTFHDISDASS